jgi:hypothetical protein
MPRRLPTRLAVNASIPSTGRGGASVSIRRAWSAGADQQPDLGSVLKLPPGWSYSTKTLTTTLKLNSNGLAYVVNDKLGDSYQRMP